MVRLSRMYCFVLSVNSDRFIIKLYDAIGWVPRIISQAFDENQTRTVGLPSGSEYGMIRYGSLLLRCPKSIRPYIGNGIA